MGTTLAYAGPQAGQAAQGFIQGRQLRTEEDQIRQGMALRAAEEGRSKESHRLNIQQLGLAINGMMQAQEQASKVNPLIQQGLENNLRPGEQVSPDYAKVLGFDPATMGDVTTQEAEFGAGMGIRREAASRPRAGGSDPRADDLRDRARLAEQILQRAIQAEREAGDSVADLRRQRSASRSKKDRDALDEQIVFAQSKKRKAAAERKQLAARLLQMQNDYSRYLGADEFAPTEFEGSEEENEFR